VNRDLVRDEGGIEQYIRKFVFGDKGCDENGRGGVIGNTRLAGKPVFSVICIV
jgi:hypothetical protein